MDPLTSFRKPVAHTLPVTPEETGDWIFITIPDADIRSVAGQLALNISHWKGKSVIHCSGNMTSEELEPLEKAGAETASMHPLQTFRKGDNSGRFKNIYVSLEGSQKLMEPLQGLVAEMGAKFMVLTPSQKQVVHIAGVMASNYVLALLGRTEALLSEEKIEDGLTILEPLIRQTLSNFFENGAGEALTGPVSRGDEKTIEEHLVRLNEKDEQLNRLYRILGKETVKIALESGRIDRQTAERTERMFTR